MWLAQAIFAALLVAQLVTPIHRNLIAAGSCGEDLTVHANVRGHWDLDDAANGTRLDDTVRVNHLTDNNSNLGRDTTNHIEGSAGLASDPDSNNTLLRTDANLSTNFPGKVGATTTSATWGGHIYVPNVNHNGTAAQKGNAQLAWGFAGGGQGNRFVCLMNDGTARNITTSAKSSGTAYHMVCTWDQVSGNFCMYINSVLEGSCVTGVTGTFATGTASFELGRVTNPAVTIDDYAVFSATSGSGGVLSAAQITDWDNCGADGTGLP